MKFSHKTPTERLNHYVSNIFYNNFTERMKRQHIGESGSEHKRIYQSYYY